MPGKSSNKNFRKPLAVKAKSNRIRKGQSSSSNPSHRKFRLEAKSKSFGGFCGGVIGVPAAKGGLTEQHLERHDGFAESPKVSENVVDAFDAQSVADTDGGHSAYSAWTTNSTLTMNQLLKQWNPSSALHKEMLAVYNATTEVIKASHGQDTDTEYFAVLMTTLESADTDISRTAAAALLTIFTKRVPSAVLRKKFSWITTMCINLMQSYATSTHIVLLRNLLGLLASCLRALEVAVWNESSTIQVFSFMFPYIIHCKPRLRKYAQKAICKVLMEGTAMSTQGALSVHPGATAVAEFCINLLQTTTATSALVSPLHVFGFLKIALPLFAQPQVKLACEGMLQIMAVGYPTVVRCGMLTLQGFFASNPPCAAMGPELNAQLTNALYDYQPRVHDARLLDVWLGMMQGAFMNLQRLSHDLFLSNLPKFIGLVVNCWLCEKTEIHYTVASVLTTMLQKCLQPCLVSLTAPEVNAGNSGRVVAGIKVIEHLHRALHYQFYAAWDQVLFVWTACFEVLGKPFCGYMTEPLQLMAVMHDEKSFTNNAVLERAMGSAIRAMGPKSVLEAVPLNITGLNDNLDFARSWMLPVLRDNIKGTTLGFFTSYFLPLAKAYRCKVEAPNQNPAIVKTYEVLEKQVWALLPGFCTNATDIVESFSSLAKTLGDHLNSCPNLRLVIMSALRLLINTSATEECTAELCKYSKNFIPILFNIYTTESTGPESESVRLAAYDTIKVFVRVSDDTLCSALFLRASGKLAADGLTSFGRHAILDLARSLVSKMTPENVEQLYWMAKVDVENSDRTVQKKAYRVLEELCRCTTPACRSFLGANLNELQHILLDTLSTATPGSRAPRLRCLVLLLDNLTEEHQAFALTALCEAVLCVKANAAKVRQAAYEVVLSVGKALVRWNPDDQSGALKQLISQLTAGFTGSPYLVSCTILALSAVLYEFKGQYSTEVLNSIIEAVEIVMSSCSREIVKSALYFVEMLFAILDPQELSVHLQRLVSQLCSLSGDCQKHFRIKVRNIFAKLIRKYGYENIVGLLPVTHRKLVSNIRKQEERKKRRREARGGKHEQECSDEEADKDVPARSGTEGIEKILQDSSDDEEPLQEGSQRKSRRATRRLNQAWIEETGENDIVDFLDASAGRRIISTDPKAAPKSQKKSPFEISEDGRLLIVDPESAKSKKEDPSGEAEVEAADLLEALSHYKQPTKKRKQSLDADAGEGPSGMSKGAGGKPSKKMKAASAQITRGGSNKSHLEPYAYLPISRTALNKRLKKPQAFKNLIRAAQKGARKGQKKAGRMKK